jgi:hypothetical protein
MGSFGAAEADGFESFKNGSFGVSFGFDLRPPEGMLSPLWI